MDDFIKPQSVIGIGNDTHIFGNNYARPGVEITQFDDEKVLDRSFSSDRRFDLCVCLGIAEKITPGNSTRFVDDLCNLSDVFLFSAAIPEQAGGRPPNARWQSYWAGLFADKGYVALDLVRPKLARDPRACRDFLRQNAIFYAKEDSDFAQNHAAWRTPPEGLDYALPMVLERQSRRFRRRIRQLRSG